MEGSWEMEFIVTLGVWVIGSVFHDTLNHFYVLMGVIL